MRKFALSLGFGFIVNNVVATLVAAVILRPLLGQFWENTIRTDARGLAFPSLLGGYFLLTLFMVIGYKYFSIQGSWLKKGTCGGCSSAVRHSCRDISLRLVGQPYPRSQCLSQGYLICWHP